MCFSTMVENVGVAQEVQQVSQQSDGWYQYLCAKH